MMCQPRLAGSARLLLVALLALAASRCGGATAITAPTGTTLIVSASAKSVSVNGSAVITGQLLSSSGQPQEGVTIDFAATLGSLQPAQAVTNAVGVATVVFSAGTSSGTAVVTATSGEVTGNPVSLNLGVSAIGRVAMAAAPASLPWTGGSTTITATVTDAAGNPLPLMPVLFTTTAGNITPANVKTDTKGVVQTTLSTTAAAVVTAVAGTSPADTPGPQGAISGAVTVGLEAPPRPVVSILPSPNPQANTPVTFTIGVAPAPGSNTTIRSVSVSFGDGATANLGAANGPSLVAQHTYTAGGTYTASVTATDSNGGTSTASTPVVIGGVAPLSLAVATTMTPTGGGPNARVSFTATVAPTTAIIASYRWEFGDGSAAQETPGGQVQHLYTLSGAYTVTVTATNLTGATAVATVPISTSSAQPAVSVAASANPTSGSPITFTLTVTPAAGSSATIQNVAVDFGDNTPPANLGAVSGSGITAQHIYTAGGTFSVTVTATDSAGGRGSASAVVVVRAAAGPGLSVIAPADIVAGTATTFAVTVTPVTGTTIQGVQISFGDGSAPASLGAVSGSASAQHLYTTGGTYTVTLTATDSSGARGSTSTVIVVRAPNGPGVAITATQNAVAGTPTTLTISVTPAAGTTVQNVQVSFGDGTPPANLGAISGSSSTQHVYASAGSYTASVTATAVGGGTTTGSTIVIVGTARPPTITITPAANPMARIATSFTIATTPAGATTTVQSVRVTFGDNAPAVVLGAVNGTVTVDHTYEQPGTYSVTATATDSGGGVATASRSVVVGSPLSLSLTRPASVTARTPVTFTIAAVAAAGVTVQALTLSYGDGTSDNIGPIGSGSVQRTKTYAAAQTYTAVLTATINGGATVTASTTLSLAQPPLTSVSVQMANHTIAGIGFQRVTFTITVTPPAGTNIGISGASITYGDNTGEDLGRLTGTVSRTKVYPWGRQFTVRVQANDDYRGASFAQITVGPFSLLP